MLILPQFSVGFVSDRNLTNKTLTLVSVFLAVFVYMATGRRKKKISPDAENVPFSFEINHIRSNLCSFLLRVGLFWVHCCQSTKDTERPEGFKSLNVSLKKKEKKAIAVS